MRKKDQNGGKGLIFGRNEAKRQTQREKGIFDR